jgi:hypothetical protein
LKKEFLIGKKHDFVKVGQNYTRVEKPKNEWLKEKLVEPKIQY